MKDYFKNSSEMRRLLNQTVHELKNDTIPVPRAKAIIYAVSIGGQILKNHDLETKIETVEGILEDRGIQI